MSTKLIHFLSWTLKFILVYGSIKFEVHMCKIVLVCRGYLKICQWISYTSIYKIKKKVLAFLWILVFTPDHYNNHLMTLPFSFSIYCCFDLLFLLPNQNLALRCTHTISFMEYKSEGNKSNEVIEANSHNIALNYLQWQIIQCLCTDHCVFICITVSVYISETGDVPHRLLF